MHIDSCSKQFLYDSLAEDSNFSVFRCLIIQENQKIRKIIYIEKIGKNNKYF